jgi:hypothetical protein
VTAESGGIFARFIASPPPFFTKQSNNRHSLMPHPPSKTKPMESAVYSIAINIRVALPKLDEKNRNLRIGIPGGSLGF